MNTASYAHYTQGVGFQEDKPSYTVYDEFYQPQNVSEPGSSAHLQPSLPDPHDTGYPPEKSQYGLNRGPSKKSAVSSFSQYSYSSEDVYSHPNRALESSTETETPLVLTSDADRTKLHHEDFGSFKDSTHLRISHFSI